MDEINIEESKVSKGNFQSLRDELRTPGITQERVRQIYDVLAETFDQKALNKTHKGPLHAVKYLSEYLKDKKESRILDVAAGTGRIGIELAGMGYDNIDALDGSQGMLNQARKKNCYKNFICDLFGKNRLCIMDDTYDAIVTTASFAPGHINDECFEELLRIVKPGGFFVLVMNQRHLKTEPGFKERLEPRMQLLEEKGAWRRLLREEVPDYRKGSEGVAFVFQIQTEKYRYLATV